MKALFRILEDTGLLAPGYTEPQGVDGTQPTIRQLARRGLVDELRALQVVADATGFPLVDLNNPEVVSRLEPGKLLGSLQVSHCVKNRCIPLYENVKMGTVVAAFANPLDLDARRILEFAFARKVDPVVAKEDQILHLLEQFMDGAALEELALDSFGDHIEIIKNEVEDLPAADVATTPQIIRLCNKIVAEAVRLDASDVHIEPNESGLEVRCRVDGVMQHLMDLSRRSQQYVTSRFKLLARMDIAEKRRPQDGRFPVRVMGEIIDIRASSVPVSFGEKVVLRLLRTQNLDLSFQSLGFRGDIEQRLKAILDSSGKMLLVTGPTGSGKTTTLYTCLNFLRDGTQNIQTVEDPVEYQIQGIHQTQVNENVGVNFASVLRSILRQDPDVIMIGEIRDRDTAEIAIQAAQTGHLVLSTLHTNSAPAAVDRLFNLGMEPSLVASTLAGVLAQRLVRRLCNECAVPATQEYLENHTALINRYRLDTSCIRVEKGCPRCNYTGFKGRTSLASLLEVIPPIAALIHQQQPAHELLNGLKAHGFSDLETEGVRLVECGITSFEEVKRQLPFTDITEAGRIEETSRKGEGGRKREARGTMTEPTDRPKRTRKRKGQQDTAPVQPEQPPIQQPPVQQPYVQQPYVQQPYVQQPPPHMMPPGVQYMPQQPVYAPVNAYPYQQVPYGYPPPGVVPYPVQQPQYPIPPQGPSYQMPPAAPPAQQVQSEGGEEKKEEPKAPQRVRIVLAEDNADIRMLVKAVLENEMFEVIDVANGREAVDAVYKYAPKAVVCDLQMPVMDGQKFLMTMRSNPETQRVPVVILTAQDSSDVEAGLLELGASDFVNKSAPTNVMLARLRRALRDAMKA